MFRPFALSIVRMATIMFAASLAGALLVRYAPGFSSDEQELNPGLSAQSIAAIRAARAAQGDIPHFYLHYLKSLARGDLGRSVALNQPVRELLRDRLPLTVKGLALALLIAWLLGLGLAVGAETLESRWLGTVGEGMSGAFISTPAAALALLCLLWRLPPYAAAGLLVFPKIFRFSRSLLRQGYVAPHVLLARAKGAGRWRILWWHVAPVGLPQWVALLGASVSVALGVLLPVEVIADVAGIGQLAWQAAQSRDIALLVNLSLVVTLLTVCATTLSDAAQRALGGSPA